MPARSCGSSPAGRSLSWQVLGAVAVGSRARAGPAKPQALGRPRGPHSEVGRRCGCPVFGGVRPSLRALFVSREVARRSGHSQQECLPAAAWQMASLSGSLPFCQGAGEVMSPRRTRNQLEGSFLASCRRGFLDRLSFVLKE